MNQPLSYVHPAAKIAKTVVIEPFTTIGKDVIIGEGTWIGSNVTIMEGARIGKNVKIFPGAVVSAIPQDLKFGGEDTVLEVGDNTVIRECVTLNRGTDATNKTVIGKNCLIMAYTHVAHDCIIGNNVVIANSAAIAGHAEIGDQVIIGGNCGVQQFTRIGKMAMIGGMTGVSRDVIPYGVSLGNRNYLDGINIIGLRRKKVSNKDIICLSEAYKEIFKTESLNENLSKLNGNFKENTFVQEIINFINKDKKRAICTPFSK